MGDQQADLKEIQVSRQAGGTAWWAGRLQGGTGLIGGIN